MMFHNKDRRLLVRTVELAKTTGYFGYKPLRLVLDSSPLFTASRAAWAVVEGILGQDVEPDPDTGAPQLKQGVAPERRPSVEDADARQGRKSRYQKFVGYKRHLAIDLISKLILAVGVAPANKPEAAITGEVSADLTKVLAVGPGATVAEHITSLSIDRAYLASDLTRQVRQAGGLLLCRALSAASLGGRFTKAAFTMAFPGPVGSVTCPAGLTVTASLGTTSHFPKAKCQACPQRAACTTSQSGRSVSIHPDEPFHQELRARQATPEGRAALRERTLVEHAISRQVSVQGRKARYKGTRKNLLATRISACVVNLHTLDHAQRQRDAV
jgi:hypothetical protein